MKNVFFALAFMLVGTFAFANNSNEVLLEDNIETTKLINSLDLINNSNSLKVSSVR